MRPGISLGARIWAPNFSMMNNSVSDDKTDNCGITPASATVTVYTLAVMIYGVTPIVIQDIKRWTHYY